jgi:hypothetical protein
MLDIPTAPLLDKATLVGGCLRLPLRVDAERLRAEVVALPAVVWGTTGGRVGVHQAANAVFLRGYAPAEGDKPVVDRPILDQLSYARAIIEELILAPRMRCLLARLPAGAIIAPHSDKPPYFRKTLRLHVPVDTNDAVHMVSCGLSYTMRAGEVWVLNNNAEHAVWNAHPTLARIHMICDFLPSPELLGLMGRGERGLGVQRLEVDDRLKTPRVAPIPISG